MEYHILALGDVTSETGVRHLARRLRELKRLCGIDFTVVNGENISGVGLTPEQAEDLFAAGADVITLGNHTWGRMQIADYLDFHAENPFTTADRLLSGGEKPTFTLVDFHAEATSEKLALGYYLDGRVSAVWGTHTHVPTADERVMPKGTGYITDLGMTGPIESVIGIRPEQSVETFLGGLPGRYRAADGPCKAQGAIFTLESDTGLCTGVERVDIR